MADARRQGILLTHQTVYGSLLAHLWVDLADKSVNIDQWDSPVFWMTDIPYVHDPLLSSSGTKNDQSPVDIIHWATNGTVGASGIEYWKQCLDLFMRLR